MKYFILRHKLSITVIIFTLLFFFTFLYVDFGQVMFNISKNGDSPFVLAFISKTWFFMVPLTLLLPLMIYFLVLYLKETLAKRKWLYMVLVILFELLYTFVVSMFAMVPGFSFYPKTLNEDILNYNNVRKVEVNVGKATYTSLYYDNNKSKVTIFFCGNGQVSTEIFEFLGEEELALSERNLLVMDYPMFGYNSSRLSETNIYKEVDSYMAFLIEDGYQYSDIRVCGYSIGTGVATYCAEKYDVESLVLFAPYHKFQAAMNNEIPVFYGPLELCVRFQFQSIKRVKNIKCNTTIFYSLVDEAIPYESTKKLIDAFDTAPSLVEIENGRHQDVLRNEKSKNYILFN